MAARKVLAPIFRSTRRFAQQAAYSVGITELVSKSSLRRSRLLILCYHGVALQDEHVWDPELFVTSAHLRSRFELLREGDYSVLALDDGVRRLAEGSLPERSVVITFDDGFHNFRRAALPLLLEFGYPSTVYVPTYHCRDQRPIPALLARYLAWKALQERPGGVSWGGRTFSQADLEPGGWVRRGIQARVDQTTQDHTAQDNWMAGFANELGLDLERILEERLFHLMSAEELADCSRNGVGIELHTHRHRSPRERDAYQKELAENSVEIEMMTGIRPSHFCYPSGNADPTFLPWLREFGIRSATTCVPGYAARSSDPLLLPRFIDTMGQRVESFECWLSGAALALR